MPERFFPQSTDERLFRRRKWLISLAMRALLFSITLGLTACASTTPSATSTAPATAAPLASSSAATSPSASPTEDIKKPGEAKVGDKTTCPVGHDAFVVKDSSPKFEYEGKTYYFCCPHCVDQFKANPKKYL